MADLSRRLVPELDEPGLERYRLRTVSGMNALVHSLAERQVLAGLFDGDRLVATVRVLSARQHELQLQLAQAAPALTPGGRRLMFVGFLDDVKVQFPIGWSSRFSTSDQIWTTPFPEIVWRLQRRRGFRVRPPRASAVWVRVRLPDGPLNLRADDLSVVGLGLQLPDTGAPPAVGATWDDVQLHFVLHGVPQLAPCALVIRRVAGGALGRPWRLGCVMEGLPLPSAQVLHQFVVDLELADRARRFASSA